MEKTNWNVSARVFCPEEKKEEAKKNEAREEGETIGLYPKGGLMTIYSDKFSDKELRNDVGKSIIHSDKFSDKGLENDVKKRRNPATERRKGEIEEIAVGKRSMNNETLRLVGEEVTRIQQEKKDHEALVGKGRKRIREEEEKIDFFPSGNHCRG